MCTKATFDAIYTGNPSPYGKMPSPWVKKILLYRAPPATVLDLGVSYGRNAIYLAKAGYTVVGVDISQVALTLCLQQAKQEGVKITCHCCDIAEYDIAQMYDIIISTATLHFIGDSTKRSLVFNNMKAKTTPGGLNIISVATSDKIAMDFPYYFTIAELRAIYDDWEIFESGQEENLFTNGKRGTVAFIIAKKNKN